MNNYIKHIFLAYLDSLKKYNEDTMISQIIFEFESYPERFGIEEMINICNMIYEDLRVKYPNLVSFHRLASIIIDEVRDRKINEILDDR